MNRKAIATSGIVGFVLLVAALLAARAPIVAALSLPETVENLRVSNQKQLDALGLRLDLFHTEIESFKTRREAESLVLRELQIDVGYVRRSVESIEREQRRLARNATNEP